MREAIISDVHANLEALLAVLKDIEKQKVDRIICLGDIVGYGADPEECIKLVRKRCDVVLAGNHEWAVLSGDTGGFTRPAQASVGWTEERLKTPEKGGLRGWLSSQWRKLRKKDYIGYLEKLLDRYQENKVLYVHGSPLDPTMQYLFKGYVELVLHGETSDPLLLEEEMSDIEAKALLESNFRLFAWLCFAGHTHHPGVFLQLANPENPVTIEGDSGPIQLDNLYNYVSADDLKVSAGDVENIYELKEDLKSVVCVGAVGQPRDWNPMACYALFDRETVRIRRVEYDVEKAARKIIDAHLPPYFAERLANGV